MADIPLVDVGRQARRRRLVRGPEAAKTIPTTTGRITGDSRGVSAAQPLPTSPACHGATRKSEGENELDAPSAEQQAAHRCVRPKCDEPRRGGLKVRPLQISLRCTPFPCLRPYCIRIPAAHMAARFGDAFAGRTASMPPCNTTCASAGAGASLICHPLSRQRSLPVTVHRGPSPSSAHAKASVFSLSRCINGRQSGTLQ